MRAKAGWFAALLYLFCVLAPGVTLALGDAASCLLPPPGTTAAAHVHEGAQEEQAASHQHHAMQADQHAVHHADAGHDAMPELDAMPGHAKHPHDGKGSMGPCCAMLCVSAIATDPPVVATPTPPISLCVSENFQRLPGEAPSLLYRPPIA
ncbi:hypothetical protein [Bradyrhizobium lablabi]|nr:hypothetical protein [Bradyrhizobium lablabi]